jgi:hypothetical protein
MAFDLFCFIASFKIPKAVELSVPNGVAGCLWPNSMRVIMIGAPLLVRWKHAPNYYSAADASLEGLSVYHAL